MKNTIRVLLVIFVFVAVGCVGGGAGEQRMAGKVEIREYEWMGPYAEMRSSHGWEHDAGLCAEVRAPWMDEGERIILRSSEIVGYETGYFYDDHYPVFDAEGRGKGYEHISFGFDTDEVPDGLSAECIVQGKGKFWLELAAGEDYVDIELGVGNEMEQNINVDWHFCVIGYDCGKIADGTGERTYLFDGERLRSLAELSGGGKLEMFGVAGGDGFGLVAHRDCAWSDIEAKAPVVFVESVDKKYTVAVGFERSHTIFSGTHNSCFHADPYFGANITRDEERRVRGRLYLMEGRAAEALERFQREFED